MDTAHRTLLLVGCLLCVASAWDSGWIDCPFSFPTLQPTVRIVCRNFTRPLVLDDPSDPRTINLWVTKLMSRNPTAAPKKHIWMIQGGPGTADEYIARNLGSRITPDGKDVFSLFGDLPGDTEFIMPDHRGTGLSSPLSCDPSYVQDIVNGLQNCSDQLASVWGEDGLPHFGTSSAARDLYWLMQTISLSTVQQVHLYGVSYGTFYVQRFLNMFPDLQLASVTLDGVVTPDMNLFYFDRNIDSVGRHFLASCSMEPKCASFFAARDPSLVLQAIYDAIQSGSYSTTCLAKMDQRLFPDPAQSPSILSSALGTSVQNQDLRMLVAPLIFRLDRCDPKIDVPALNQFFNVTRSPAPAPDLGFLADSTPVFYTVVLSDLGGPGDAPSFTELLTIINRAQFTVGISVILRLAYEFWPRYQHDEFYGIYPVQSAKHTPILILNGDLDPNTPMYFASWEERQLVAGVGQEQVRFIKVPTAPHATLSFSKVTGSDIPCGLSMFASFTRTTDPSKVDTTCISALAPLDWTGTTSTTKQLSQQMFGQEDPWSFSP